MQSLKTLYRSYIKNIRKHIPNHLVGLLFQFSEMHTGTAAKVPLDLRKAIEQNILLLGLQLFKWSTFENAQRAAFIEHINRQNIGLF